MFQLTEKCKRALCRIFKVNQKYYYIFFEYLLFKVMCYRFVTQIMMDCLMMKN